MDELEYEIKVILPDGEWSHWRKGNGSGGVMRLGDVEFNARVAAVLADAQGRIPQRRASVENNAPHAS